MQTNGKSAWENIKSLFQSPNAGIKEMADWIPYIDLTAEGYLVMRDRRYQNMVQIESHDLNTLTESDKNRLIEEFSRFLTSTNFPQKYLSIRSNVDTSEQRNYWAKMYRNAKNDLQKKRILHTIEQLKFVEENATNQEYYLLFSATSIQELQRAENEIYIFGGQALGAKPVPVEKKLKILDRLMNMSSYVDGEE